MRPLVSRGEWAGRTPFGDPRPHRWDGPVAAVTRARIKTAQWRRFWSAVPPVSGDLRAVDGLRLAIGIGEAPVGLQGTFSVWGSNAALTEFAHRRSPHTEVMRRTHEVGVVRRGALRPLRARRRPRHPRRPPRRLLTSPGAASATPVGERVVAGTPGPTT